jgi:hypothetical protein
MYKPLKVFVTLALLFFVGGASLGGRFLYFYLARAPGEQTGHIQSLILAAILLIGSFIILVAGLLADLVGANRKLLEDSLVRLRRLEYDRVPRSAAPPEIGQASHDVPAAHMRRTD